MRIVETNYNRKEEGYFLVESTPLPVILPCKMTHHLPQRLLVKEKDIVVIPLCI